MIRYSQNPSLDLKTVETVNGETEYRVNCRKVKDKYYVKNVDIFYIDDTWFRVASGKIIFDSWEKKMVIKDKTYLNHGVVGFDSNKKAIYGSYTPNVYYNCYFYDNGDIRHCMDYRMIPEPYFYSARNNCYAFKPLDKGNEALNPVDYRRNNYSIDDNQASFESLKKVYAGFTPRISKDAVSVSKHLGDVTFGVELECISGYIPTHFLNQFGVSICRDGSLVNPVDGSTGPEYVTVPLQGAKGVQTIIDLCKELAKTNKIDQNCALHIHLGNIRTDRTFLVALYKLGFLIQNDMFKMFPLYKTDEVKYAGKQKNYCKKLKNYVENFAGGDKENFEKFVTDSYKSIFQFLLDGNGVPNFSINRTSRQHPEREKWRRVARYYWINFMNMFFSNRNTIEFRLHTPTLNSTKILNWLLIINAVCRYASENTEEILKGKKTTIAEILSTYDKNTCDYLLKYYKHRVEMFKEEAKNGNYMSLDNEIGKDNEFKF